MKVRHRPTVVDAVMWDDSDGAFFELVSLGYETDCGKPVVVGRTVTTPGTLMVPTSEGHRPALPGESYVIRGTQGEWYPIHKTVFAAC